MNGISATLKSIDYNVAMTFIRNNNNNNNNNMELHKQRCNSYGMHRLQMCYFEKFLANFLHFKFATAAVKLSRLIGLPLIVIFTVYSNWQHLLMVFVNSNMNVLVL